MNKTLVMILVCTGALALCQRQAWATAFSNPSFESGDFAGWVTQDLTDPFVSLQVGGAGFTPGFGLFTSAPTDGAFAALHGFDGDGATGGTDTIRIAQDVTVSSNSTVLFDYRAGWDLLNFASGAQSRLFDVNVEPSGGGGNLQNDNVLTATGGTFVGDTGDLTGSVDLSSFVGQNIRVSFDFIVPENFTGPAFFQLDNIRSVPEPAAGIGLLAVVAVALLRQRRR